MNAQIQNTIGLDNEKRNWKRLNFDALHTSGLKYFFSARQRWGLVNSGKEKLKIRIFSYWLYLNKNYYSVFKKEGVKVEGYYTAKKDSWGWLGVLWDHKNGTFNKLYRTSKNLALKLKKRSCFNVQKSLNLMQIIKWTPKQPLESIF